MKSLWFQKFVFAITTSEVLEKWRRPSRFYRQNDVGLRVHTLLLDAMDKNSILVTRTGEKKAGFPVAFRTSETCT